MDLQDVELGLADQCLVPELVRAEERGGLVVSLPSYTFLG